MTEVLKTVAIDIKGTVFEFSSESILYITKDIYSDSYIVSIPSESFSFQLWKNTIEKDFNDLLRSNSFGDMALKERLVNAIREGIEGLE